MAQAKDTHIVVISCKGRHNLGLGTGSTKGVAEAQGHSVKAIWSTIVVPKIGFQIQREVAEGFPGARPCWVKEAASFLRARRRSSIGTSMGADNPCLLASGGRQNADNLLGAANAEGEG